MGPTGRLYANMGSSNLWALPRCCRDVPGSCADTVLDADRMFPRNWPAVARPLPGHCRDGSRLLLGHRAGYCPDDSLDVARRLTGRCRNIARMNLGNCPALAAAFPPDNRRIAGVRGSLIQIRGWCLTKMNGFPFQKAATNHVRLNVSKWMM